MGVASLVSSGLIYDDKFTSTVLDSQWEVISDDPSRVSLDGTKLRLLNGASAMYMFFTSLTDTKQFVLDMENTYNPTTVSDYGGIIIYSNDNDYIVLEEYFDEIKGIAQTYPWIRLVRDHNNFYCYYSNDGINWNLIGTETFDGLSPKIGIVLGENATAPLDVTRVRIFMKNRIVVDNLPGGMTVKLLDSNNLVIDSKVCVTTSTKVEFDVSHLPIPFLGKFEFSNGLTTFQINENADMWGGDLYSFEITVDIYFEKEGALVHLDSGLETFLGYLNSGTALDKDFKLYAKNNHNGKFIDVKVALAEYQSTDHFQRLVLLANESTVTPGTPGTFSGSILLGTINPSSQVMFFAKLKREYDPAKYTTMVYFGLNVTSSYEY